MQVYYDQYNVICCGDDADLGIADAPNIVQIAVSPNLGIEFPKIDVTDQEYAEFLAVKKRFWELANAFQDRIPDPA
jgi:hypothetical protein